MTVKPNEEQIENVAFAIFQETHRLKGFKADLKSWTRLCKRGQENYRAKAKIAIETWEEMRGVRL